MKVFLCYQCYDNHCEIWRSVEKVVDCEVKALVWKEEFKSTATEWREYYERDVE